MHDRLIIIFGFAWMTAGLMFIAWQCVKIAHIAAEVHAVTAALLKLH